jgi:tetratricopeptide (TPR) repeat protein
LLLRRLSVAHAWFGALLFALHPVCVESVAWISEQKNTLSTALYLGAALVYLRFDAKRNAGSYVLATILFALALLAKTVTASLPAAILVVLWWRRGRLSWRRDISPLLPWFVIGVAAGVLTIEVERTLIGTRTADYSFTMIERVLIAGRVLWFYAAKLLWPADLIFIYPRWTIDASAVWQYVFPIGAVVAFAWLWWCRKRQRGPLAAALFFAGTLVPALGFVNVFPFAYSFVADHFQYVACLGLFAIACAGLAILGVRTSAGVAGFCGSLIVIVLGVLTWRQSHIYQNEVMLYETTIARNPGCWMAHNNLGLHLALVGRTDEALDHFRQSLAINPQNAEAENNLGSVFSKAGRHAEALPHFRRALELQPDFADARHNVGMTLASLGKSAEALAVFEEGVRQHPRDARLNYDLGVILATLGRMSESIPCFERTLELQPEHAEAEFNLGLSLAATKTFDVARPHFERALELKPDSAAAHRAFARLLGEHGQLDDAVSEYRTALRLEPNSSAAHYELALALQRLGKSEEAQAHFREAQRLGGPRR